MSSLNRPDINMAELWGQTTEYQKNRSRLFDAREWFASNLEELRSKYAGKLIAVWESSIIATGMSPDELWNQVGDKYPHEGVLLAMVPEEEIHAVPYPVDMMTR